MAQLFIAVETFVTHRRGRPEIVNAGEIAGWGNWVIENNPAAFRPLEVRWPGPAEKSSSKEEPDPALQAALSSPATSTPASPATLRKRGGGPRRQG